MLGPLHTIKKKKNCTHTQLMSFSLLQKKKKNSVFFYFIP